MPNTDAARPPSAESKVGQYAGSSSLFSWRSHIFQAVSPSPTVARANTSTNAPSRSFPSKTVPNNTADTMASRGKAASGRIGMVGLSTRRAGTTFNMAVAFPPQMAPPTAVTQRFVQRRSLSYAVGAVSLYTKATSAHSMGMMKSRDKNAMTPNGTNWYPNSTIFYLLLIP